MKNNELDPISLRKKAQEMVLNAQKLVTAAEVIESLQQNVSVSRPKPLKSNRFKVKTRFQEIKSYLMSAKGPKDYRVISSDLAIPLGTVSSILSVHKSIFSKNKDDKWFLK